MIRAQHGVQRRGDTNREKMDTVPSSLRAEWGKILSYSFPLVVAGSYTKTSEELNIDETR